MSELQQHYDAFKSGWWAVQDPDQCPCNGGGWALSEVDTWHKCPAHYKNQPHPEDYEYEEENPVMKLETADLWSLHAEGYWGCILTNGITNYRGELVMGAGIALQAVKRYHSIKKELGTLVKEHGNHVYKLADYRLYSFPTKEDWKQPSSLTIIQQSCRELMAYLDEPEAPLKVYLPRPGCGLGQLDWDTVSRAIEPLLDYRVVVITR